MSQYTVGDDLALRVERLAKQKPFENINFQDALRRIVEELEVLRQEKSDNELDLSDLDLLTLTPKKLPSPEPSDWLARVPELKNKPELSSWKAICDYLKIETSGDSARRRLKKWVATNRPDWPAIPEPPEPSSIAYTN